MERQYRENLDHLDNKIVDADQSTVKRELQRRDDFAIVIISMDDRMKNGVIKDEIKQKHKEGKAGNEMIL